MFMTDNNLLVPNQIPAYEVNSVERIKEGFQLFAKAPGVFISYFVISWVIVYLFSAIPFLGPVLSWLLTIVQSVGFYILLHNLHEKGTVKIEECFQAFDFMGQATLGTILGSVLTILGFILLIIPGLYLCIAYQLFMPFVLFDRLPAWDALEKSRKVITARFWRITWFTILCLFINFLGACALGIGLLVTMPTTTAATYMLYRHIKRQIPQE